MTKLGNVVMCRPGSALEWPDSDNMWEWMRYLVVLRGILEWLGKWAWVKVCYTRGPGMINRDYYLKHHETVKYLEYYPHSNLNGESLVRRVLKTINTKLNLLLRQRNYLNYLSRRLPYNALIQAHFDYGCTSRSISWE